MSDRVKYLYEKIDRDIRVRLPFPTRIVIGRDAFDRVVKEMDEHMVCGLNVNQKGEYTRLFGMDIEIDEKNRDLIFYDD